MRRATVTIGDETEASLDAYLRQQYHRRAGAELEAIQEKGLGIAVGYATVCEAYTLVLRRLGCDYARQLLAEILAVAVLFNPEPADYVLAAPQLDRLPDQPITLVDAVTAVMAGRLGVRVWTFDRHFGAMRVKLWR